MLNTQKQVALVEWHWVGHHPTFFAYFVLALEELGIDVLAICPQPDDARQIVAKLREQYGLSAVRKGQTVYRQVKTHHYRFLQLRPHRISAIDWSARHFRSIEDQVKMCGKESGKHVDLIFYACIYDSDFDWFNWIQPTLSLPWSGLYLQAPSFRCPGQSDPLSGRLPRPEKIFRGPLCRSVVLLDEGIADQVSAATDRPTVVFPDLTNARLPTSPQLRSLGNRLTQFTKGRPTVGLFGHLKKSKGILPLALVSQNPAMSEICFVFGGEVAWRSFSSDESKVLCEAMANGENIWTHLLRIPDEEQLNFLISACDVIYAAYMDFPHSSNILAKAALLKKPLIVSDGYLMAERVRRFRMGEVIPQGDLDSLAGAIERTSRDPEGWVSQNQPMWEKYNREHSFERLKEAFLQVFAKL